MYKTYLCVWPVLGRSWASWASRGWRPPRASCKEHDLILPATCTCFLFPAVQLLMSFCCGTITCSNAVWSSLWKHLSCCLNSCWLCAFYSSGSSWSTRPARRAWRVWPKGKYWVKFIWTLFTSEHICTKFNYITGQKKWWLQWKIKVFSTQLMAISYTLQLGIELCRIRMWFTQTLFQTF